MVDQKHARHIKLEEACLACKTLKTGFIPLQRIDERWTACPSSLFENKLDTCDPPVFLQKPDLQSDEWQIARFLDSKDCNLSLEGLVSP